MARKYFFYIVDGLILLKWRQKNQLSLVFYLSGRIFSVFALVGCTHSVRLESFSEFPRDASWQHAKVVKSKAQQFAIMGFVFDTQYADNAYSDLQKQCAAGNIYGISSKYYTDHGFFSWTNNLEMQGYCM